MYNIFFSIIISFYFSTFAFSQEKNGDSPKEFKFPSSIDQFVKAKGGDVLAIRMDKLKKIAVFDIISESIIGFIPIENSLDFEVLGTKDSIIIISKDKKFLQRWSIEPLKKKVSVVLPSIKSTYSFASGYNSNGPILMLMEEGPRFFNSSDFSNYDIETPVIGGAFNQPGQLPCKIIASGDGHKFAVPLFRSNRLLCLNGKNVKCHHLRSNSINHKYLIPNEDGSTFFSDFGVTQVKLDNHVSGEVKSKYFISACPTLGTAFYLSLVSSNPKDAKDLNIGIYSTIDEKLLLKLDELPELEKIKDFKNIYEILFSESRIIANISLKKILIINISSDIITIFPFDINKALKDKNIEYLFVESNSFAYASTNKLFEYQFKIHSNSEKVSFKILNGPKNMTISFDGLVKWSVPNNFKDEVTSVLVSIEGTNNKKIEYILTININGIHKPLPPIKKKQ